MTDSPDNQIAGELEFGLLESRWKVIEQAADRIADEVDIKSVSTRGNYRKQTLRISHFFRSGCEFQRALNQSCVLAVANPLAQRAGDGELSDGDITDAVHVGLCTLSRHGSTHKSLFQIFLYPILLTWFVAIASVLASHFLLGPFEQMYAEFGIMLPAVTRWFFSLGNLIRTYTVTILMVIFGVPPLLWLINWIGQEKREPGMSRLDVLFSRKRAVVSRFLLHVSLLIDAGISKDTAIETASAMSGKRWLRRRCANRARKISRQNPKEDVSLFDRSKLRMADTALMAPRSRGKITLLQHVATWYRDTSTNIIEWFVQLLIPIYVLAILLAIFALVMGLLMPLFAIVSGLTGGGPGGFM